MNNKTNHVYKLNDDLTDWKRIYPNLPVKIGGITDQGFQFGNEFCTEEKLEN